MSDLEQEEAVWRITRQYVAEARSGRQPQLRSYLARYPKYAAEIADFIAYYQEFEAYLQDEDDSVYVLPSNSFEQNVLARSLQPFSTSSKSIESLLASGPALSVLAQELDLSEDILLLLERRLLLEETLPIYLVEKLAALLHQPEFAVRNYLRRAPVPEKSYVRRKNLRFVAEEPEFYTQNSPVLSSRSLLQAIEESTLATIEQKQRWRVIIERNQEEKNAKNSLS